MAPKGTTKAAAPKKAAAATAKSAPKATTTKKAAAAAPKPAVNGTSAASKKRKADDDEPADGESSEDVPKTKKAKTTKEPVKKVAAVKKTTTTTSKAKAAAAPAPAKKEAAAPVVKKVAKKSATPKSDVESASESEPEKEAPKKAEPKKAAAATKKAEPKKAAPKKAAVTKAAPKAASKRKATEEPTDDESDSKKTKNAVKPKKEAKPKAQPKPAAPPKHPHTVGRKINDAPTTLLDVYVFGEGSSGELGLGSKKHDGKKPIDVKRPRINHNLARTPSSDGILGFNHDIKIQMTPLYIPELKSIKALAAGSNHILALENKGNVLAWGCGQQNQLGRRIIERNKMSSLVPQGMGIPKKNIEKIACGQYHSFALDTKGRVYAWGLNNFAETGIREGAGEDDAVILRPTIVDSLEEHKIVDIAGGQHHSLACTEDGKLLTWGRFDGFQVGFAESAVSEDDLIRDESNNARILAVPTVVPSPEGVVRVAAGTDNNFAITKDGKAYSWGFSSNYQTGQGTIEDVEAPTLIDNTAVRGQKLVSAGAGGQFSILCGVPAESS
ncbi:regulator of chromosome condensation [Verticillium alfalfae VaMs.102]|uniref:Regulator of chromosome condensation n=1 Tax=Verticillium alfalfae (strain VaMs.102 / ATCC MYA-4576 / FGSC 10136) TaxID=526221 RepID=C9SWB7_VERA1|nr:regulator of chromosome condensation [Verticillium alfalfae VaMs.102]EEY23082.1 regulator of chromosome condensation [Verticillium alfalfae VaMs.102]